MRDRIERSKSVYIRHFDQRRNRVRLSLYGPDGLSGLDMRDLSGNLLAAEDVTSCHDGRGRSCFFRVVFPPDNQIVIRHCGQAVRLRGNVAPVQDGLLTLEACRHGRYHGPEQIEALPTQIKALRTSMCEGEMLQSFEGCWLLADRPDVADDNAEHFYRYVAALVDGPKIFFLLSPDSPHWNRLKCEGFRLVAFRSPEHLAALVHGRYVISSQDTPNIRYPFGRRGFEDLCRAEFVFLQHGIIVHDCSSWINQHHFDCFVTSTPQEYHALTDSAGPYNLTSENTVLTGLARHDALHAQRDDHQRDIIAIVPTWRNYLVHRFRFEALRRVLEPESPRNSYEREWYALLASDGLRRLARERNCRIVLLAHPNIRARFRAAALGDHIEIPGEDISYQDIILRAVLCVTDYSSVAMDMAAVDVPVVYFQFPEKELVAGWHTFSQGYFDYARDGFGPVTHTCETALSAMSEALEEANIDMYAQRRASTFTCFDGRASERLYAIVHAREGRP